MKAGIYWIINKGNAKMYVGSAVNIQRRFADHRKLLHAKKHHSAKLQNAWNKYGADAFEFKVVEEVEDVALLVEREQFWLDFTKAATAGYNVAPRAFSLLGFKHSPESIAKCRAARLGKKMSPETAEALRKANTGRKLSPEHVAKLALSATGRRWTPGQAAKVVAAHLGAKRSQETRRKISEAMKGNQSFLGKSHTEESKAKISRGKRGNIPASRKLNMEQAEEIRALRAAEGLTYAQIGQLYGVTGECIGNIVRGVTYTPPACTELGVTFYDLPER